MSEKYSTEELIKYMKDSFDDAWHDDVEFVAIIARLRAGDVLCEAVQYATEADEEDVLDILRKAIADYKRKEEK